MAFYAGQYLPTIGGSTIGQIQAGITIEHFVNKELVTGDNEGKTPQDAVYQGTEVFVEFICMETKLALVQSLYWPYSATVGDNGAVGQMDVQSNLFAAIVLTAVSGTPADGNPQTITLHQAVLAEGFPVRMLYAPALRTVPFRLRLYPNASGLFYTKVYSS